MIWTADRDEQGECSAVRRTALRDFEARCKHSEKPVKSAFSASIDGPRQQHRSATKVPERNVQSQKNSRSVRPLFTAGARHDHARRRLARPAARPSAMGARAPLRSASRPFAARWRGLASLRLLSDQSRARNGSIPTALQGYCARPGATRGPARLFNTRCGARQLPERWACGPACSTA
jgi:hypothetical protein